MMNHIISTLVSTYIWFVFSIKFTISIIHFYFKWPQTASIQIHANQIRKIHLTSYFFGVFSIFSENFLKMTQFIWKNNGWRIEASCAVLRTVDESSSRALIFCNIIFAKQLLHNFSIFICTTHQINTKNAFFLRPRVTKNPRFRR